MEIFGNRSALAADWRYGLAPVAKGRVAIFCTCTWAGQRRGRGGHWCSIATVAGGWWGRPGYARPAARCALAALCKSIFTPNTFLTPQSGQASRVFARRPAVVAPT